MRINLRFFACFTEGFFLSGSTAVAVMEFFGMDIRDGIRFFLTVAAEEELETDGSELILIAVPYFACARRIFRGGFAIESAYASFAFKKNLVLMVNKNDDRKL